MKKICGVEVPWKKRNESGLYGVSVNMQSGQCLGILLKKIAGLSFVHKKSV